MNRLKALSLITAIITVIVSVQGVRALGHGLICGFCGWHWRRMINGVVVWLRLFDISVAMHGSAAAAAKRFQAPHAHTEATHERADDPE